MRLFPLFILACLFLLFAAFPANAQSGGRIDGVWAFDVDATIVLMREAGELPAPLPVVKARLAAMRITIDTMRKTFLVTEGGKEKDNNPIVMISEQNGVITLHRKERAADQYRPLDDGRLMGIENGMPVFILKKAE